MFTNLHTHTEYSLLDGLARIPQLMDRVRDLGQRALAITDHGAMYGVIEFYKAARERGIKPIIGVEAYVAPGSRHSRDPREKTAYYHLTLLARNLEGYRNLMALTTLANLEGYYYKPRMDREILAKHGAGLIALTGCPSGELFKALQDGREDDARAITGFYRDVFDDVFLEIQDHPDARGELRGMLDLVNPRLVAFSRRSGIPLAATNDSHYTLPEDAAMHEILLCIGTNATIDDPKRFRLEGDSYYLISEEEIRRVFRDLPEAVDNTERVAEACDLTLDFGRVQLPDPELPPGLTSQEYLERVCWEGLPVRYGEPSAEHRARLAYELEVVRETGFAAYMLIVAEIARAARERRIAMGVRGSAAASIILYCLGVTDIDPVANRLVFERFLNVERREMPDVDMDFADDRREEMIRWAAQRYGHDRVAQIITFGTLGAKAAIRDVGRALGMSFAETDRVARLVPAALHMTLDRALTENQEFKQVYEADAKVRRLVDSARRLEGVARHAGTHAAGVLISREPLIDVIPLQKPARGDDEALPVTQFEMNTVAEIGLLKMDFLGLSNLTILAKAVELIRQTRSIDLDLKALPDGDPGTYEMLAKGETFAVFQLESAGMRRFVQELKPTSVAELSALVALYRPGPMQHIAAYCRAKQNAEEIRYPHLELKEILDETYGIIVYQDQVLHIMRRFAGYSMGEADKVRKAMGKKIASLMAEQREKFVKGATKQGYSTDDATAVFDLIEPFAGYAFNKCVVGGTVIIDAVTGQRTTVGALFARPRPFTIHALGEDGRLRPRSVTKVMANGVRPVFELRTALGHCITATANHPFRTPRGWTNLADLRPGDRVAVARQDALATSRSAAADGHGGQRAPVSVQVASAVPVRPAFPASTGRRLDAGVEVHPAVAVDRASDIAWDEIVAIEPRGEAPTYDLTVDVDHNFVADGIVVHNSHSVCYGTIAYQTAYLKANYPAEYMTAVLALADAHPSGFAERVGAAVAECAKLGIEVRAPHINHSSLTFSIEQIEGGEGPARNGAIRFGLATIKNVGAGAVEGIVQARLEDGPFASLEDFCRRAALKGFNKRTLESLIKAGAFDGLGYNRTTLVTNLDRVASLIAREQRLKDSGQSTMFDLFGESVAVPLPALELEPVSDQKGEVLSWERDLLGVYVSDHPFKRAHGALAARISAVVSEVTAEMSGRDVTIAGMVASVRTLLTKAGRPFAAAVIEDLSGSVEVTCWPDVFERTRDFWQPGRILLLSVRVRTRDERLDVTVDDAGFWDDATGAVVGGAALVPSEPAAPSLTAATTPRGWDGDLDGDDDPRDADPAWEGLAPEYGAPPPFEPPIPVAPAAVATTGAVAGPPPAPAPAANGRVNGNGHGNGNGNGRKGPYARPEPKPIPTEDRGRRMLRIEVRETTDEAADRRRLNELVQLLRTLPGPDEARLTLQTAHDRYTLALGTVLATDGIDQRLRPVLEGWGEAFIEPLRTG